MAHLYILDADNNPVVLEDDDIHTWAVWFETATNRQIADTTLDIDGIRVRVSTVFLGLDYSFGDGPPVLFETMIFGGEHNDYQERYCTYQEAIEGHKVAIKLAGAASLNDCTKGEIDGNSNIET